MKVFPSKVTTMLKFFIGLSFVFCVSKPTVLKMVDQPQTLPQKVAQELGMGYTVQVRHTPKHSRQSCDVIYAKPPPDIGPSPVVKRFYNPLSLRQLTSALVVANTSLADLKG